MLYFFPNCLYKIYSSGLIPPSLQNTMQWFAVTLLNGRLPYLKPSETPILVETTEDDLLLTFAASDVSRILNSTVMRHRKVEVFGDPWDLVTVKCVSCPRDGDVLMIADCAGCRTWACCGRGRSCSPTTSPPRRWPPAPVSTPWWTGGGSSGGTGGSWSHLVSWGSESSGLVCRYHVKGLHKSVEEVKERNGPFAGKRVSRPVADYEACHSIVLSNIQKLLGPTFEYVLKVWNCVSLC